MFKRIVWIFVVWLLMVGTQVQAANWTVWLYNPSVGSITQVTSTGDVVDSFTLPLSQAFNSYGAHVVVSPSGRYVAYTTYDSTVDNPNFALYVYDRNIGTTRFTYDISSIQAVGYEYRAASLAFDEPNERFAFGYLNATNNWEVVIADFKSSSVLATVTANAVPDISSSAPIVPIVHRLNGSVVTFSALAYGTNYLPSYPTYRVDYVSGQVTNDGVYTTITLDSDPGTGQVAAALYDESKPHYQSDGPTLIANVLQIITPDSRRIEIYNEPNGTIQQVRFIENGARILVEIYEFSNDRTVLKVLNRDGTITGEMVGTLEQLTGTPDGFVGLFNSNGGLAVGYVNTTAATLAPVTLWSGAGTIWSLVAVMPG